LTIHAPPATWNSLPAPHWYFLVTARAMRLSVTCPDLVDPPVMIGQGFVQLPLSHALCLVDLVRHYGNANAAPRAVSMTLRNASDPEAF
jgi:hypothetical protein